MLRVKKWFTFNYRIKWVELRRKMAGKKCHLLRFNDPVAWISVAENLQKMTTNFGRDNSRIQSWANP